MVRLHALGAWLWFELMYVGDRAIDFGRKVGRLVRYFSGHLWESWMSRHKKRNELRREEDMINRGLSKMLDDLYRRKALSLHRMNFWIARFADAGIHDVGYDPDPRFDARALGKPWWKPVVHPHQKALKSRVINHLLTAKKVMGHEYAGLSVAQIKTKLKDQKQRNAKHKEGTKKTKTRKFEVVTN